MIEKEESSKEIGKVRKLVDKFDTVEKEKGKKIVKKRKLEINDLWEGVTQNRESILTSESDTLGTIEKGGLGAILGEKRPENFRKKRKIGILVGDFGNLAEKDQNYGNKGRPTQSLGINNISSLRKPGSSTSQQGIWTKSSSSFISRLRSAN